MEYTPLTERVGTAAKEHIGRRASLALLLAGIVWAGVKLRRAGHGELLKGGSWQSLEPQLFGYPKSLDTTTDDATKKHIATTHPKQFFEVLLSGQEPQRMLVLSYLDRDLNDRQLSTIAGESAAAYRRAPEATAGIAILSIGVPENEADLPSGLQVKVDNEADNQAFQAEVQRTLWELRDPQLLANPQPVDVQVIHHV